MQRLQLRVSENTGRMENNGDTKDHRHSRQDQMKDHHCLVSVPSDCSHPFRDSASSTSFCDSGTRFSPVTSNENVEYC